MKKTEAQQAMDLLIAHLAPVQRDLTWLKGQIQECYDGAHVAHITGDIEHAVFLTAKMNGLLEEYWTLEAANIAYLNRVASLQLGVLNAREVKLTLQEFSVSN
jgi:hypothetical protein